MSLTDYSRDLLQLVSSRLGPVACRLLFSLLGGAALVTATVVACYELGITIPYWGYTEMAVMFTVYAGAVALLTRRTFV